MRACVDASLVLCRKDMANGGATMFIVFFVSPKYDMNTKGKFYFLWQ